MVKRPKWLDEGEVRRARREAWKIVKESLRGERTDSLAAAIIELYRDVPRRSWIVRAVTRLLLGTVDRVTRRTWRVYGVPALGDWYAWYVVSLEGGKYVCSCFSTRWGHVRRRRICTHIAAVILRRRQRLIEEYLSSEPSTP